MANQPLNWSDERLEVNTVCNVEQLTNLLSAFSEHILSNCTSSLFKRIFIDL